MQQLRRGSAAVVRPSEENVASSSQLPRAGWQVYNIYHHYKHQIQHPPRADWQVVVIYNIINIKTLSTFS